MYKFVLLLILSQLAFSWCIFLKQTKRPSPTCTADEVLLPMTTQLYGSTCDCPVSTKICVPTNYYFHVDSTYEIHSSIPQTQSLCTQDYITISTHAYSPTFETYHTALPRPTQTVGYYCEQSPDSFHPDSTMKLLFTPLVNTPSNTPATRYVTVPVDQCRCVEKCSCASHSSIITRTVSYPSSSVTFTPNVIPGTDGFTTCYGQRPATPPAYPSSADTFKPVPGGCVPVSTVKTALLYARSLDNPYRPPNWEPVLVDSDGQVVYQPGDQMNAHIQNCQHDEATYYHNNPIVSCGSDSVLTVTVPANSLPQTTVNYGCSFSESETASPISPVPSSTAGVVITGVTLPSSYPCTYTRSASSESSSPSNISTVTVTVSNCNCANSTSGVITTTEGVNSTTCIVPTGTVCLPLATLVKYNVSLVKVDDIPMDVVFNYSSATSNASSSTTTQTITVAQVCNGTTSIINTTTVAPSTISSTDVVPNPSSSCSCSCENPTTVSPSPITTSSISSTVTQTIVTTIYPNDQGAACANATAQASSASSSSLSYCGVATTQPSQMIIVTNSAGQPVSRMNISITEPVQCNAYLVVNWDPSTVPSNAKYIDFYVRRGHVGKAVKVLSDYPLSKFVNNDMVVGNVFANSAPISVWNNADLPAGGGYIVQARAKNATTEDNGIDLAVGWSQVFELPSCGPQTTSSAQSPCTVVTTPASVDYQGGYIKKKACKCSSYYNPSNVVYYTHAQPAPTATKVVYVQRN